MIGPFIDEYAFLSNFYPAEIELDGKVYKTVENAYQAAKTLDKEERRLIQGASPGKAKRLGKCVTMRNGWDSMRIAVMFDLLRQKFSDPRLREMLLSTHNEEIVEINTWKDTFWGVYEGRGSNWLGKLLMKVRDEVR